MLELAAADFHNQQKVEWISGRMTRVAAIVAVAAAVVVVVVVPSTVVVGVVLIAGTQWLELAAADFQLQELVRLAVVPLFF